MAPVDDALDRLEEHDVDRDDFLRGVVEELKPANERWPGLWTRLESLLNERDRLERHVQDMESLIEMASDPYRWDEFLAALSAREKEEE